MKSMPAPKTPRPEYVQRLAALSLTRAQEEQLRFILRDPKGEKQRFFRVRDVLFEALARQKLGDAEFSRLVADASEKAKTVLLLSESRDL